MNNKCLLCCFCILFTSLSCEENAFPVLSEREFSGFGYVRELGYAGSELQFTVYSETSRVAAAVLRCRCLDGRDRQACRLLLNGNTYDIIVPEAHVWQNVTVELALQEGNNCIRVLCDKTITHDFHVDYLSIE